jgi:hypothetical protein
MLILLGISTSTEAFAPPLGHSRLLCTRLNHLSPAKQLHAPSRRALGLLMQQQHDDDKV